MTDLRGIDLYHGILPSHMKIDVWEEYARLVLSWLEPSVYSSLELSDKPDLIDTSNSLGVEVTWSLPQEDQEISALYARYRNETDPGKRSHLEERLFQLGARINDYGCLHPTGRDGFSLIHDSHEEKLEKLNQGQYKTFNHNHLFIMSDIYANKEMLEGALLEFEKATTGNEIGFERVIVAVPEYVYTFDLQNSCYSITKLNSSKQYELGMVARQNVLDAERDVLS